MINPAVKGSLPVDGQIKVELDKWPPPSGKRGGVNSCMSHHGLFTNTSGLYKPPWQIQTQNRCAIWVDFFEPGPIIENGTPKETH